MTYIDSLALRFVRAVGERTVWAFDRNMSKTR